MCSKLLCCIIFLSFGVVFIESKNILAIFPTPHRAHFIVAEPLLKKLLANGHNLTVISQFPQKFKTNRNWRDIVIEDRRPKDQIYVKENSTKTEFKDHVEFLRNMTFAVLQHREVQALITTPDTQFELVLSEVMLMEALYAFAPHFGSHLIGLAMQGTDISIDRLVGNISPMSYVPVYAPNIITATGIDFFERLNNLIQAGIKAIFGDYSDLSGQHGIYRQYFPHLRCRLSEISKNFSLVLLNQHFTLSMPRPYVPNMIEVGGLYVPKTAKALPADIAKFIDEAEFGVIYCAMGAEPHKYEAHKLMIMFDAFAKLHERVLLQHEKSDEPGRPANVLIRAWFNQFDILAHPKVKLFITHGGYLSLLEAIFFAKPIIGLPKSHEEHMHMLRAQNMGIAEVVPYDDLLESNFENALEAALSGIQNLTAAVKIVSQRFHDQPRRPLDVAAFWIEYILRNEGAPYMRVAARDLQFWQYYCLDVFIFCNLLVVPTLLAFYHVGRFTGFISSVVFKHFKRTFRAWRELRPAPIIPQLQLTPPRNVNPRPNVNNRQVRRR